MLSVLESLELCRGEFPRGPEALARKLNITIEYDTLEGCDGWCVHGDVAIIVRINKGAPLVRQRFTLAHELAHLLLTNAPDVEILAEFGYPSGRDEQIVDRIAAEMLLPSVILRRFVKSAPVSGAILRSIAADADVSEMVVAQRIISDKEEIGITNAFMADFRDATIRIVPKDACPKWRARALLAEARPQFPADYAYLHNGCRNLVTSLETPYSTSILVQSVCSAPPDS